MIAGTQEKQREWHDQWSMLSDHERFLFEDWIAPSTMLDFAGKEVLEGGCGGGQHTGFVAEVARSVTAVDLNTTDIARRRNAERTNVEFVEADLCRMDLGRQFDVVFSIGVIHHTDDPDRAVANLARHVRPGGRIIIWVYSDEGNGLVKNIVEPLRKVFLRHLSRNLLLNISRGLTGILYMPVHSVYRLPVSFLPYYEYFGNFRKLSFERNTLNVFDKLNAPQVQFITRARAERWLPTSDWTDVQISPYKGVSWRASAVKRQA